MLLNDSEIRSDVIFTRVFNAPVATVFNAWTDEKQIANWWGPWGFTNPICNWKAVEGAYLYIDMTAPDGMVFPVTGRFHTIEFPKRLVFTSKAFADEEGNAQLEVLNTVLLDEMNGKTKFTMLAKLLKATPLIQDSLEGMEEGWNQSLDKLQNLIEHIK